MWIKRKGSETINLDHVIAIEKYIRHKSDEDKALYIITFHFVKNSSRYTFDSERECEDYHEALMDLIGAEEIPLLKIS